MALESSGRILYVAKISYQSHTWKLLGGTKTVHRHTHTETHTHTDTHTQTNIHRHTDTHTHTHTHTHTQGGPFYKSCFSAKIQKQD